MKKQSSFFRGMEVRVTTDGTSRTLVGLIPYNKESSGLPWVETISPGAFSSALVEGADVLALRDHMQELLLGRTTAGTLQLRDTSAGLQFTITLPNTTAASDLIESISRKDIDGVSFGFFTNEDEFDFNSTPPRRTLRDVTLFEISVTSFAAYPDATVAMRSLTADQRKRFNGERRTNSEGCDCPCSACAEDDDCSECDNPECDFDCPDCPEQEEERTLRLRIEVAKRL